jgi:hypothetical protein
VPSASADAERAAREFLELATRGEAEVGQPPADVIVEPERSHR